jgi:hypothetical protein
MGYVVGYGIWDWNGNGFWDYDKWDGISGVKVNHHSRFERF